MNQAYSLPFASVGKDVTIWPTSKIICPERISIGDSVIIDDFVFIMGGESISIGSFVHIGSFTSIAGGGEMILESFSGLSGGVRIYTGNEDYSGGCLTNPTVPYPFRKPVRSFVIIKKHAIVGANSVILPGVVIGEGAVVGANSLVTKDCKPWTVYFGSPAKELKRRKKDIILDLEERLKQTVYDSNGCYIPSAYRETK
ncbi:acyltransferase [Geobacter hydrogenophilus]|uniref:Chloramphenicol acetyltransferase n=1 Tax=Geobacter hydrogenophilus TaxID=40983 RepID=A0A9W6G2E7_9BACT|nr:acyltransferase [Geobacter hydrogenophilus]MBT0892287.1 acyltransferase [Geobacter hydrogenophilus]GLI39680.1 LPS biosynthesis O-acetyl transferase [Geobacter hydrogenophilus]